jgi:hypothetical protein
MRKVTLLFAFIVIIALIPPKADAKIWRVNNKSNYNGTTLFGDNMGGTASFPVFKEVNNAVTWGAVVNNDTIHVEGSTTIYAQALITKKLVIIGPGYFLTENPKTSSNVLDAKIAQVLFNAGSSGSQLIGINNVSTGNTGDRIYLNVSDLLVKRCRIELDMELGTAVTGLTIVQNFFTTSTANAVRTNGNTAYIYPSDVVFNNNICQRTLIWAGPVVQCNNNVFDGPANVLNLQFSTSEFKNNILKPTNATANINGGTNLNVSYNTGTSAVNQFGTTNNNVVVADMTTLFVTPGTTDGKYQLKPGSAAGSDGADRGAFGGATLSSSYALSGLAAIPVVYVITTTGVAGPSGLPVTIQARIIN